MYPIFKFIGKENICKDVNIAFPPQHQDSMPGLEYPMIPIPISENPCHKRYFNITLLAYRFYN